MKDKKTCEKCGQVKPANCFYSLDRTTCKECRKAAVRARRKVEKKDRNRSLLMDSKTVEVCTQCGTRFPRGKREKTMYCSESCRFAARIEAAEPPTRYPVSPQLKKLYDEAKAEAEKIKRREEQRTCKFCGELFAAGRQHKQRKYCSTACGQKSHKQKRKIDFRLLWEIGALRQGGKCWECGKTLPKDPRRSHRHHLNARVQKGSDAKHNLVVVCDSCHPRGQAKVENLGTLRILSPAYMDGGLRPWSYTDDG